MYSQFITYILVILIFSVYQPKTSTLFSFPVTIFIIIVLVFGFSALTRMRFGRLSSQTGNFTMAHLDHRFNRIMHQQIIAGVLLFTALVHIFNLPDFLLRLPLVFRVPTLSAVFCMSMFVLLMAVIWKFSHKPYCDIYQNPISLVSYAKSNIAFALPIIFPWLLLSLLFDGMDKIPDETLHGFFASGMGELIIYLAFIIAVLLFGPVIIQKLWGCKPLAPGIDRLRVEALCRRADLAFTDILYWPIFGGKMITAGIMGFFKTARYIFVTPALLRMLTGDEMDTVIAHEIGHVKKNHMFLYLLLLSGYLVLVYAIINIGFFTLVFYGFGPDFLNPSPPGDSVFSPVFYNGALILSFIIYFRYVFAFFIRNFERQADAYVFQLFDSAAPLIRTFEKIAFAGGVPPDKPNWHHFSLKDRMAFLRDCEADRNHIKDHDKKVGAAILGFVLLLVLAGIAEYGVTKSTWGRNRINTAFEKQVLAKIQTEPENSELYGLLGDFYLGVQNFEQAVMAYQRALSLRAENSHVLNNLAWLYATGPDPAVKNPEKALALARKAAALSPTPETLDTLAESLFVNGKMMEAFAAGKKAMTLALENPGVYENQIRYYEKQLEKFTEK